jgi:hypothetical protein
MEPHCFDDLTLFPTILTSHLPQFMPILTSKQPKITTNFIIDIVTKINGQIVPVVRKYVKNGQSFFTFTPALTPFFLSGGGD